MPARRKRKEVPEVPEGTIRSLSEFTLDLSDEQYRYMLANVALWLVGHDEVEEAGPVVERWIERTLREAYITQRQDLEQEQTQQAIAQGGRGGGLIGG